MPERAIYSVLGVSRSTLQRRRVTAIEKPRTIGQRRHHNALSKSERAAVLDLLNSDRFVVIAPAHVIAQLLDEGVHLCSVSTMYRLSRANEQVRDWRNVARHPEYRKPELLATGTRQVFS